MSAPPYRSGRDRHGGGGLAADYYDANRFYGDSQPYAPDSPPRSHRHRDEPDRPSRRHKSEHRRAPAADYDDVYEKPSRHRTRRSGAAERPEIVPDPYYGKKQSSHEPSGPSYAREPERARRRDDDRDRERRSRRHERSMPPPAREAYDVYPAPGYSQDRKSDRRAKAYRGEPEPRSSRRQRRPSPSPEPRPRRHDTTMPRSKGGHHRDYDDYYGAPPPRRARSHERARYEHDRSPPRGRPTEHGSRRSRGTHGGPRRKSVPANPKSGGPPWWQNPMLQAGARYAFTAGAQAALRNKDEQGPWMGPKGAKVATAALSAALVDGIIAQKQSGD